MRTVFIIVVLALIATAGWFVWRTDQAPQKNEEIISNEEISTNPMRLTSAVFEHNGNIPADYTCDGNKTKNPPLTIYDVPEGTKSLAIIMDDPDVPKALRPDGVYDHWVVFNIPSNTREIPEGGSVGTLGANTGGKSAYTGPCPPREYEPSEHRYIFKLYALDTTLTLAAGSTKKEVLEAMTGHIIAEAELIGKYRRP